MKTKTLEYWEKEMGFLVIDQDARDPKQKLTLEEAAELSRDTSTAGVNHEDRVQFLLDNGYEVTHENMLNTELSAKPKDPVKKKK